MRSLTGALTGAIKGSTLGAMTAGMMHDNIREGMLGGAVSGGIGGAVYGYYYNSPQEALETAKEIQLADGTDIYLKLEIQKGKSDYYGEYYYIKNGDGTGQMKFPSRWDKIKDFFKHPSFENLEDLQKWQGQERFRRIWPFFGEQGSRASIQKNNSTIVIF
jgi:hypothetical protein